MTIRNAKDRNTLLAISRPSFANAGHSTKKNWLYNEQHEIIHMLTSLQLIIYNRRLVSEINHLNKQHTYNAVSHQVLVCRHFSKCAVDKGQCNVACIYQRANNNKPFSTVVADVGFVQQDSLNATSTKVDWYNRYPESLIYMLTRYSLWKASLLTNSQVTSVNGFSMLHDMTRKDNIVSKRTAKWSHLRAL